MLAFEGLQFLSDKFRTDASAAVDHDVDSSVRMSCSSNFSPREKTRLFLGSFPEILSSNHGKLQSM